MLHFASRQNNDLVNSSVKHTDYASCCSFNEIQLGEERSSTLFGEKFSALPYPAQELQLFSHLIRLKELCYERLYLSEQIHKHKLDCTRLNIATEKHREAALRTVVLRDRITEILQEKEEKAEAANKLEKNDSPVDLFPFLHSVVGTLCFLGHTFSADPGNAERVFNQLISIYDKKNKLLTPGLKKAMRQFFSSHHLTQYTLRIFPIVSHFALTRHMSLAEEEFRKDTTEQQQRVERQLDEQKGIQESRRKQLVVAKERLEMAEKSAFMMRKKLFTLRERIMGRQQLSTGGYLNSLIGSELLYRIRADLEKGEMDFLFYLTTNDGMALNNILENQFLRKPQ